MHYTYDLDSEHTIQYTDDILQNCKPATYIFSLTNVTPIKSVKRKTINKKYTSQNVETWHLPLILLTNN